MRFLVLGAGQQGFAAAFDLARRDGARDVTIADIDLGRAEAAADRLRAFPECRATVRATAMDVGNEPNLIDRLRGYDVAISAVPYFLNLQLTRAAIEAGVSLCDLGGNTELVREQERLDAQAKAAGVAIVPDCGLAPGMANVLAAAGIARLDRADTVRIRVGGLPLKPKPLLEYMIVFSMHGLLNEYLGTATVLRDGRRVDVETLTEVEELEFAKPAGRCEAFVTLGGASTMPWTYEGRVKTLDYKTVRYPGHAAKWTLLRALGLLDTEPVVVEGISVAPRAVFAAAAEPRLTFPGEEDLVVMRVVVEGVREGRRRRITFEMIGRMDVARGMTAMMRATAYPTAAAALMIARGDAPFRGVAAMERALPPEAFLREVRRHEMRIRETDVAIPTRRATPKGARARPAGTKKATKRAATPKKKPRSASKAGRGAPASSRARKPRARTRR